MKAMTLSTKLLLASGMILILFFLASFGILFRAQSRQATQEMDHLLKNETLALSVLVNTTKSGQFDFEMSPLFLAQYEQHNPNGFFRFFDPQKNQLLRESSNAPAVMCNSSDPSRSIEIGHKNFRVESYQFVPEADGDASLMRAKPSSQSICIVVGIDEEPYNKMVMQTLIYSIPILIVIVMLLSGAMLILVRTLTGDLSTLTKSLATADFSATHAFPILPTAKTLEVKAVSEKLESLHSQAADVYKEMWLFLGRAAHQMKTPVTAIQATLEVLLRKERSKEELLAGLEDVKAAATLLSGLTKKLILSSRISYQEVPPKEIIDLDSFFSELISIFRSHANENGVDLEIRSHESMRVIGNQSLMSDIFGNLVENAILYSPKAKNAKVIFNWTRDEESVLIEISDEGPGFPREVVATLFEPFIRGDEREVAGSGLGLSIAKKSTVLLGGSIELKESTSLGSKIVVTLPVAN